LISHATSSGRAGVMVSGSHIPFDRNGIKLNKTVGEVLKSDEPGIAREVERVRAEEYGRTADNSLFDVSGTLKRPPDLPPLDRAAEEAYVQRYVSGFTGGGLSGLRILVYQHSAVGRDILPRILGELGAEVIAAGRSETFVSIDTENITEEQLDRLEEFAVAAEASGRPRDAIVSTDGDSVRPLVTAVLPAAEVYPGGGACASCPVIYWASWSPSIWGRTAPRCPSAPTMPSKDAWASAAFCFSRPRSAHPMSYLPSTSCAVTVHASVSSAGKRTADF
jgi:phosphomannomutase